MLMKEAILYKKLNDSSVQCELCSHFCLIPEGKIGRCSVRENKGGRLYSLVYGKPVSRAIDPIEKKPLYHFLPGSRSYSIATVGCNFSCEFCQNSDISQASGRIIRGDNIPPEAAVKEAVENGCESISYTYTEPTVFWEYMLDIARIAKKEGIRNVIVTNGFMSEQALGLAEGLVDAANVDLKSFDDGFYKKVIGGRLKPVLENIKRMHDMGIWVEITTLIIPEKNDSEDELRKIAEFIAGNDKNIPWHISRFYPHYKYGDVPPTPIEKIRLAQKLGKEAGLRYVYPGNVPTDLKRSTLCPRCGKELISREGFFVSENNIRKGKCKSCGEKIAGIFE